MSAEFWLNFGRFDICPICLISTSDHHRKPERKEGSGISFIIKSAIHFFETSKSGETKIKNNFRREKDLNFFFHFFFCFKHLQKNYLKITLLFYEKRVATRNICIYI